MSSPSGSALAAPAAPSPPPAAAEWTARWAAAAAAAALAAALGAVAAARPDLFRLELAPTPLTAAGVAAGLAAAALARRPAAAAVVLAAAVCLNLSEVLVRYHGLPSLLQLFALPLLAAGVLSAGRAGVERLARLPLTGLTLAYLMVVLLSTAWAAEPSLADARVIELAKGFAVFVLAALLASSARRLRAAIWTAVGAGSLLALLGAVQFATGAFDSEFGGLARVKHAQLYGDVFEPRIAGPLGDPNFFAQILVVLVPLALALAWGARRRRGQLLGFAAAAVLAAGAVLTYSRAGALVLAVVLALSLLGRVSRRQAAAAAALVALLVAFAPAGFTRRLATLAEVVPGDGDQVLHPDSSFEKRRLVTAAAWRMFLDHPGLGVGAANYTVQFDRYADLVGSDAREYGDPGEAHFPHSLYLEIAAETGLAGLAAWAAVIAAAFAALVAAHRRFAAAGDPASATLARGLALAVAGYLLSSLFLHGHFQRYLWLLLGLAAAAASLRPEAAPGPARETGEPASPAARGGGGATAAASPAAPAAPAEARP